MVVLRVALHSLHSIAFTWNLTKSSEMGIIATSSVIGRIYSDLLHYDCILTPW
jgi:hypothetical protein